MSNLLTTDPMEQVIERALQIGGISYYTENGGNNPSCLDFALPQFGVEIEVKRFHSPRVAEQMSRAENVIVAQGDKAVALLAMLLSRLSLQPIEPMDIRD